jgi:hypothetical protein
MSDEGGIVTHLTALEEIASMKVLCSDKTGAAAPWDHMDQWMISHDIFFGNYIRNGNQNGIMILVYD